MQTSDSNLRHIFQHRVHSDVPETFGFNVCYVFMPQYFYLPVTANLCFFCLILGDIFSTSSNKCINPHSKQVLRTKGMNLTYQELIFPFCIHFKEVSRGCQVPHMQSRQLWEAAASFPALQAAPW